MQLPAGVRRVLKTNVLFCFSTLLPVPLSLSLSLFLSHFLELKAKKNFFVLSVPIAQMIKACVAEQKDVGSNLAGVLFLSEDNLGLD